MASPAESPGLPAMLAVAWPAMIMAIWLF